MRIDNACTVSAPVHEAWTVLTDIERIAPAGRGTAAPLDLMAVAGPSVDKRVIPVVIVLVVVIVALVVFFAVR